MFRQGAALLPGMFGHLRVLATLRKLRRPVELAAGSYLFFRMMKPSASYDKDLELVKRVSDESLNIATQSTFF